MGWSCFSVRMHVKEALIKLKEELRKSSYSATIEYLIEFYREHKKRGRNVQDLS